MCTNYPLLTPLSHCHISQTGIPNRSDRSGLCATQDQKFGVSEHLLEVSGLPSPEFPGLNSECLNHHKPGVSEPMAGLSGPLPVRPVPTTGPYDRSDRSYPDQNLRSLSRLKSPTNSKTLLGTSSGVHLDVFDQKKSPKII